MITKAKKTFVQTVVANNMKAPEKADPIEFAERMWDRLGALGYGDPIKTNTTAKTSKPRVSKDWLGEIKKANPVWFEYFNMFWTAWADNRGGKNEAARAWLTMCQRDKPINEQLKHVVYAAGITARGRKAIYDRKSTPIMAQGWLNNLRYNDVQPIKTIQSQALNDAIDEEIRVLLGDQAMYKIQLDKDPENKALKEILETIEINLEKARKNKESGGQNV